GLGGDEQLLGYLAVATSLRHEDQNLDFALGEAELFAEVTSGAIGASERDPSPAGELLDLLAERLHAQLERRAVSGAKQLGHVSRLRARQRQRLAGTHPGVGGVVRVPQLGEAFGRRLPRGDVVALACPLELGAGEQLESERRRGRTVPGRAAECAS